MTLMKFARAGAVAMGALAITTTANAADLYAGGGGLKDVPYHAPSPTFAGFYLGGSFGSAWGNLSATDVNGLVSNAKGQWDNSGNGVFGGGQIGYNLQYGGFVIGPEADFGGIAIHTKHAEITGDGTAYSRVAADFYLDATGRLGYATGPFLTYVKGGYAYYDGDISYIYKGVSTKKSGIDGWTLGGGLEYKMNPSWSMKAEFQSFTFDDVALRPDATHVVKDEYTVNAFKFGLNYFVGRGYESLK
jgi:outer membrane immunogenic protein